jgi:hypothetical protein
MSHPRDLYPQENVTLSRLTVNQRELPAENKAFEFDSMERGTASKSKDLQTFELWTIAASKRNSSVV